VGRLTKLVAVLAAVGLVSACGAKKNEQASAQAMGPPTVAVSRPLVKDIVDWDEFVGRFEAVDSVEVRPRVDGYVQSVNFKDGDIVRKGQLLFVIDPRPFEAALGQARAEVASAKAALANAKVELARAESLVDKGWISRSAYDAKVETARTAQAAVAAAEANQRAKALDVQYTRITAPISGRVSDRRVSAGNLVSGTVSPTLLTTVVSLDPIRFAFTGSEAVYLKYQRANEAGTRVSSRYAANPVEIRLQDETDYRWKGRMDFVDNAIDTGSGTIRGRAVVPNRDLFLTPGMYGHLRLLGSGAYPALLIPDTAVQTDQADKIVLVVGPGNEVQPRKVELGPIVDGLRVVRSGLQPTDAVIVEGGQRARPGVKVKTKPGRIVATPGAATAQSPVVTPPASEATGVDKAS
jgi:RND family efflux transporter MFP subunit